MLVSPHRWKKSCLVGFFLQLGAVIAIATCAWLGVLPTRLPQFPHFDLLGHAFLIGLLAFFLDGALGHRPLLRGRLPWLGLAPVAVLSLAGIEEALQTLGTNRTASLSDFAADVLGVTLLSWLCRRIGRFVTTSAVP